MIARGIIAALLLFPAANLCAYEGSSFAEVRRAAWSEPYAVLPQYEVNLELFGAEGEGADNHLRAAARRTLSMRDDVLVFPGGRKLVQANGICFTGAWRIGPDSPWTGLLGPRATALVIARASVALSATQRGERRAFGMAVKLFPTEDPLEVIRTENLFVMETLVGSRRGNFTDAVLDNSPELGGIVGAFSNLALALRLRADLNAADREFSGGRADFGYRPVTGPARRGLRPGEQVAAPRWLRLRAADDMPRIDAQDFRDELRVENYPESGIVWQVEGADGRSKTRAQWLRIGTLQLRESVVSKGCDGRLHFAHPPLE